FKDLGGAALEVACGSHTDDHLRHFARLTRQFDLYASRGSDFHCPGEGAGRAATPLPPLPEDLKPVWRLLDNCVKA
ncbi:MAG: phosphatase, partial [Zoogloeaceae bacterium]|nr:phosphatase [Zoogloeaceae bacterium]